MAKTKEPLAIGKQRNGVVRRSENTYLVRIMVDGHRKHINAGNDYQAAMLLAEQAKHKKAQERLTGHNKLVGELLKRKSNLSIGELVERYIETRQAILKPLSIRFYKNTAVYLKPIYGSLADDLTITEITEFIKQLQAQKLSAKTINHVLALARAACNFGIKEKFVEKNAFNEVPNLRLTKHEPNPFNKAELSRIFVNLDKHVLPYFILQAATGMRTGELMALRFKDIDFKNNKIRITRSRWRKIEDSTKTAGSERTIFISKDVKEMLKDLKSSRRAGDSTPLVINKDGEPYQVYLHRYWKKALKAAKVAYRPNYVLRSTFASMALQDGVDIAYVSKTLGHASIRITTEKYMRHIKGADQRNRNKIDKMIDLPSITSGLK